MSRLQFQYIEYITMNLFVQFEFGDWLNMKFTAVEVFAVFSRQNFLW